MKKAKPLSLRSPLESIPRMPLTVRKPKKEKPAAAAASRFSAPPVRSGGLYCAPWCGGGCTWAAFLAATKTSDLLAKKMGCGWTARVWENLGWHWEVRSPGGHIIIWPVTQSTRLFHSGLAEKNEDGMRYTAIGSTPIKALNAVILVAKKDLAKIGAFIPVSYVL